MTLPDEFPLPVVVVDPIVIENKIDGLPVPKSYGKLVTPNQPHITYATGADIPLIDKLSYAELGVELGFTKGIVSKSFGLLADRTRVDDSAPDVQQRWFGAEYEYPGALPVRFAETPSDDEVWTSRKVDYLDVRSLAAAIQPLDDKIKHITENEGEFDESLLIKQFFGKKTTPTHYEVYRAIVGIVVHDDHESDS